MITASDARRILATEARRYNGTKEIPQNRGIRVDYWNFEVGADPTQSPAWCCSFASQIGVQAFGRSAWPFLRTASVPAIVADAKKRGLFTTDVAIAEARAVLAVILFPTLGGYHHIQVVIDVLAASKKYEVVEGNSNDDGSREGYEVVEHSGKKARSITDRVAFILWPE